MALDKVLTQQQELFLSYYTNPKSETFSNAYKSALKAKYSEEYAENITHLLPDWLSENIGDLKRLRKAESILDKVMDLEPVDEEGRVDNQLIANQLKAATLVARGLGKSKYSERQEHTGADGKDLPTPILGTVHVSSNNSFTENPSVKQED